jgi:hypothetical protein
MVIDLVVLSERNHAFTISPRDEASYVWVVKYEIHVSDVIGKLQSRFLKRKADPALLRSFASELESALIEDWEGYVRWCEADPHYPRALPERVTFRVRACRVVEERVVTSVRYVEV